MSAKSLAAALLGVVTIVAVGCGGAEKAPAKSPDSAPGAYSGPAEGGESQSESPGGFAEPPGTTLNPPPGGGGAEPPERMITTVAEAETAFQRDIDAVSSALSAGKDCDRACKAFGSMGRSSERICELNGPDDPEGRCKKAKERVDMMRAKLRRVCGGCAE
jgi:hypothetical protein